MWQEKWIWPSESDEIHYAVVYICVALLDLQWHFKQAGSRNRGDEWNCLNHPPTRGKNRETHDPWPPSTPLQAKVQRQLRASTKRVWRDLSEFVYISSTLSLQKLRWADLHRVVRHIPRSAAVLEIQHSLFSTAHGPYDLFKREEEDGNLRWWFREEWLHP